MTVIDFHSKQQIEKRLLMEIGDLIEREDRIEEIVEERFDAAIDDSTNEHVVAHFQANAQEYEDLINAVYDHDNYESLNMREIRCILHLLFQWKNAMCEQVRDSIHIELEENIAAGKEKIPGIFGMEM